MSSEAAAPPASEGAEATGEAADLRILVFGLFFVFGGITSLNDVLIPRLKALFTLSYGEAMLCQSAFFAAYFLVSLPAAALVRRLGYLRGAVVGLSTMAAGCLLFVPASLIGRFPLFLLALFVLAAGITTVQVIANPLISRLGPGASAASRLTFAQAFNSLGTTLFPWLGAWLFLEALPAGAPAAPETGILRETYLGLALILLLAAACVWTARNRLRERQAQAAGLLVAFSLLRRARFAFGVLSIFLYVGAEVTIGSLMVAWLMQPWVLGLGPGAAGAHVPFYWGGAMCGRFLGAALLRLARPGQILAVAAAVAILLLLVAANGTGGVAGWALIAIGLFNSIMFPTIFSLASDGLGARAAEGSGIICMAIVGGALVPLLTGHVADLVGLPAALAVPASCYAGILAFGWSCGVPRERVRPKALP